jgi:hypothetical protein
LWYESEETDSCNYKDDFERIIMNVARYIKKYRLPVFFLYTNKDTLDVITKKLKRQSNAELKYLENISHMQFIFKKYMDN